MTDVVTGGTDQSRSVDIRGLSELDGGTQGVASRFDRPPTEQNVRGPVPILIAHGAETTL